VYLYDPFQNEWVTHYSLWKWSAWNEENIWPWYFIKGVISLQAQSSKIGSLHAPLTRHEAHVNPKPRCLKDFVGADRIQRRHTVIY